MKTYLSLQGSRHSNRVCLRGQFSYSVYETLASPMSLGKEKDADTNTTRTPVALDHGIIAHDCFSRCIFPTKCRNGSFFPSESMSTL